MKLSIITINYNNKAGLLQTVESVINQTFNDFEYIVIDGGSDDGSVDVLTQYENRITYSVSEKDNGIFNAMNKGILKSTGEYLLFLNSGDCLVDATVIEDFIKQGLNAEIIEGNTLCLNKGKKSHIWYAPEFITANTFYSGSICHQSAFIKRHLFDSSLYNEGNKIVSDWEFFFDRLIFKGASYKKMDRMISTFDVNGMSNDPKMNLLHLLENKKVKDRIIPKIWHIDLEDFIGNRSSLEVLIYELRKNNSFVVKLMSWIIDFYLKVKRRIFKS